MADNVTIEQLIRYCEPYLIKDIAKHMLIGTIEEGSLKITWFIPTDKVAIWKLFICPHVASRIKAR